MRSASDRSGVFHRHPVVTYFIVAYAISWAFWLPLAASSRGMLPIELPAPMFYSLAALGPFLAGLIVARMEEGPAGPRALLRRLTRYRVAPRWYLVAVVGYPAIYGLSTLSAISLGDSFIWPWEDLTDLHMSFGFLLVLNPIFVLGEEIGWRGYALPHLQERRTAIGASLILGVLWGLWHIPSFLMRNSMHHATSFPLWLAWLIANTVVMTWLFNSTGGSVLHTWLYHAMFNYAGFLTPISLMGASLAAAVYVICVFLIIILAGPKRLGRPVVRGDAAPESDPAG